MQRTGLATSPSCTVYDLKNTCCAKEKTDVVQKKDISNALFLIAMVRVSLLNLQNLNPAGKRRIQGQLTVLIGMERIAKYFTTPIVLWTWTELTGEN